MTGVDRSPPSIIGVLEQGPETVFFGGVGGSLDHQLETEVGGARLDHVERSGGKQSASTKKRLDFDLDTRRAIVIASAAAVASSSSEALASSRPVRSRPSAGR